MDSDVFEKAKALFLQGIAAFEADKPEDAEACFEASLALLPQRVSTLTNLAATRIRLAKPHAALEVLDRALALDAASQDAWWQRGVVLFELRRYEEALVCHARLLALDAAHAEAWQQQGMALNLLHRHTEALVALDHFLQLQPAHAEGWFRHGQTLEHLDRPADALQSYERAVAADPAHTLAWSNRGNILKGLGRFEEAAQSFQQAITAGGDAQVNAYFLASVQGQFTPAVAPARYVQSLFDGYAESFDTHLVEVLRYRAPEVLVQHLRHLTQPARFRRALDLGCGTGLCGPLLAPFTDVIDGVDIAAGMLEKARSRGLYRHLVQADIAAHLQALEERYDLVVAADVFIYIGDLQPVFAGVARAMEAGGMFCFSVEWADDTQDFVLKPSLRYGQSRRYIHYLARQRGFVVQECVREVIREDHGQPIDGWYCCLRRA